MVQRTSWTLAVNAVGPSDLTTGKRRLAGGTARAATTDEVKDLRREARDLKEVVAEQTLELRLFKKSMSGGEPLERHWSQDNGERRSRMRYAASEKLEIIELVKGSHRSARKTLAKPGIPRTTFYRPLSGMLACPAGQRGMTVS